MSNTHAQQRADAERRRRAASALGPDWTPVLGGLIPPPGDGPLPQLSAPDLPTFRRQVYSLEMRGVAGRAPVEAYLESIDAPLTHLNAVRDIGARVPGDRRNVEAIRQLINWLNGWGDIAIGSLRIVSSVALMSADGKKWLPEQADLIQQLEQMAQRHAAHDAGRARHLRGLAEAIRRPLEVGGATPPATVATVLTPEQQRAATALIERIQTLFPPDAAPAATASLAEQRAARTVQRTADRAKMRELLDAIRGAESRVKNHVYAWRNPDGHGVLDLLRSHLSPSQVEDVNAVLDPVECLLRDLRTQQTNGGGGTGANRRSSFQILFDFLQAHAGDEPVRMRVRNHAQIMQHFVQMLPGDQNRRIMRMVVTGRDEADAVEKLYEAAAQRSSAQALQAIMELGAQPARLQQLRSDHLFLHRLQLVNDTVEWNGIQVKPYDLFLQMCGINPHELREPGAVARQHEVNPDANTLPLNWNERTFLDRELYQPCVDRLVYVLNRWYVNDNDTLTALRNFQHQAGRPHVVALLRRANEPPGPTLCARIQARGTNVRTAIRNGLDDDNIPEAERILGLALDQAAVGVIGGRGTLATDNNVRNGQGVVPLEQALRETQVNGMVLSRFVHEKAREMASELDESWVNGWAEEDDVRNIWSSYTSVVNDNVCNDLRRKTGLPRVWAIELLSNAFVQVGGGSLQAKLNDGLSRSERGVIREMGMLPGQIETRRTMAQQNLAQTAENEAAAAAMMEAQAQALRYEQSARELFAALSTLRPMSDNSQFQGAGRKLAAGLGMGNIAAPPASATRVQRDRDPGARFGGPAANGAGVPTSFRAFYRRNYGIDPTRHAIEVAKTMGTRQRQSTQIGEMLGVSAAEIDAAVIAPPEDGFEITEENRTLVGPDFTIQDAESRAQRMWDQLHGAGQVQLIRNQLDGRTQEEQRLIHIAFRRLSGGIDLRFYLLQARQQQQTQGGWHMHGGVGGRGVGGDTRQIHVAGRQSEIDLLLDVTQHGRVSIEQRIRAAIAGDNMDELYSVLEAATAEDRREILANDELMNALRRFADDAYEWSRVHRTLTGEVDLFDRLESRAHGAHGFWNFVDFTDEKGMEQDIRNVVRQRRRAIRAEVTERGRAQTPPMNEEQITQAVDAQLRDEMNRMAHNPSIREILRAELSGTELSVREGLILNAGQDSLVAYTLNDGDWTDDEDRIIDDIKKMPLEERRRRRNDPEFLRRLQAACEEQTVWRDVMNALNSEAEPGQRDNLAMLEQASRTYRQDTTEMSVDEDDVIEILSRLTSDEYTRLMSDSRLQAQVLSSLDDDPEHLRRARELLAYRNSDAAAETGLTVAGAGRAPDLGAGVLAADEVQRLGYLKWRAVQHVTSGANRSWGKLLEGALEAFKADLAPRSPPPAAPATPAANSNIPAPAAPAPDVTAQRNQVEQRLRGQVWSEVSALVTRATQGWGRMGDRTRVDPAQQLTIVENAIKKQSDPSNYLLDVATGLWDDEDRIKETLRTASDDVLISEWTTVAQVSPSGGGSLRSAYQRWARERPRGTPGQPRPRPRVGSPEWEARTAFQTHVIDTSRPFEERLLHAAGGIFSDTRRTGDGEDRTRDNAEWLEWRTIIRDRIPNLDRDKIARAVGAENDPEAVGMIKNNARDALTQLRYDEENYSIDRGEISSYNMDRLTAGGEGQRMDNTMADYRREVLTGVISDPRQANAGETYGVVTQEESDRIGESRERFNQSRDQFRAAKQAVADIACAIVAIVITAVVTILTAGTATGPVAAMLIGAMTAGAASLGANATREAIQGTSFEFTNEGLTNIARDTVMGAVTAGSIYYAGRMTNALFAMRSAQTQAQTLQGVLRSRPPFVVEILKEGTEEAFEEGLTGLFEAGVAPFDPALWHEGFSEGWLRGSRAARDRAATIPSDMMRAAATSALTRTMTHGAGSMYGAARRRLRGGAAGPEVELPDNTPPQHAAFGNRMPLGQRARFVMRSMFNSLGDGSVQGGAGILLDEATWRAEGQEFSRIFGGVAMAGLTQMREAAQSLHVSDALVVQRARAGATQLALHGGQLSSHERQLYSQLCMVGESSSVISVEAFQQIRSQTINESVAHHEATTGRPMSEGERRAYEQHLREATSIDEFHRRAADNPAEIPAVRAATARQDAARVVSEQRGSEEKIATEKADPAAPTTALITQVTEQHAVMAQHRTDVEALRAQAAPLFQQILADLNRVPANSDAALRLRAELAALHQMFTESTSTAMLAVITMSVLPNELRAQLAQTIPAGVDGATQRQQLYDTMIAARVRLATLPGQATTALASARAMVARLEALAARTQAASANAVSDNAATVATADLPAMTPPTAPLQQPAQQQTQQPAQVTAPPVADDVVSTDSATPAELARLHQLVLAHGEIAGHQIWIEWRAAQILLADDTTADQGPIAGNASTMAGSTFRGDSHPTDKIEIGETISDVVPGIGRFVADVRPVPGANQVVVLVYDAETTTNREVVVTIVAKRPTADEAAHPARFERNDDGTYTITISSRIDPEHVERAIAHELAEIRRIENQDGRMRQRDHQGLTPHMHGRMAELRVLRSDLATALAEARRLNADDNADPEQRDAAARRVREIQHEISVVRANLSPEALALDNERRARDEQAALLDGERGHSGIEVHSHFMGNVDPQGFVDAIARNRPELITEGQTPFEPLLDQIAGLNSLAHRRDENTQQLVARGVSGDAIEQVRAARAEIARIRNEELAHATDEGARAAILHRIDVIARDAVDRALRASETTDFNSAYEIRDELIKQTWYNPNGIRIEVTVKKKGSDDIDVEASRRESELASAYAEYAKHTLIRLAQDRLLYTEQSNSTNKLQARFTEECMRRARQAIEADPSVSEDIKLAVRQLQLSQLTMLPTAQFGQRDFVPEGDTFVQGDDAVFQARSIDTVIRHLQTRPDVVGVDIAGSEHFSFDRGEGVARFIQLYQALLEHAKQTGRPVVLRPHVGEGANDVTEGQAFHGTTNRQTVDDAATNSRRADDDHGPPAQILSNVDRARRNIEALLQALETLQQQGLLDPSLVVVRFGHATHASNDYRRRTNEPGEPARFEATDQLQRMADLGVIMEVNLGSNILTFALDQNTQSRPGQPSNAPNATSGSEMFDDHSLTQALLTDVQIILSTDAHSVMNTNMAEEYRRARTIIEDVISGNRGVPISEADAIARNIPVPAPPARPMLFFKDMRPDEKQRFLDGYRRLHDDAQRWLRDRPNRDTMPVPRPPDADGPIAGSASALSGTRFVGDSREVNPDNTAEITRTIDEVAHQIPMFVADVSARVDESKAPVKNELVIAVREGDTDTWRDVRVRIEARPPGETARAHADVANFEKNRDGSYTVYVSSATDPANVQRAIAHELAEIRRIELQGGKQRETDGNGLTPHQHGRLAELRVLRAELASAQAAAERAEPTERAAADARVAALQSEISAVRKSLSTDARAADNSRAPDASFALAEVLAELEARYGSQLQTRPPVDTELTPAPDGTRTIPLSPTHALIGLPAEIIPANLSSVEAVAQLLAMGDRALPRWEGLTAAEREHETNFAAQVMANLPKILEEYYNRSKDPDLDTFQFEVDAAKKIYAPYGDGKKPANDDQRDVRATANHALHPIAVVIARLAFLKRLDELQKLPDGNAKKTIFVTNGGCAAGKGDLANIVAKEMGSFEFGAVWDAAGEGDAQENAWILQAAQARGLKVTFGFVTNNPMQTYEAVLSRADTSGRIVDPVTFVRSYVRGQQNMHEFLSSPEYLAAVERGEAETMGMWAGKFDLRNLDDKKTYPGYPDAHPLGDNGRITAADLASDQVETDFIESALNLFDRWMAQRATEGKDSEHWYIGAVVNANKFGSLGEAHAQLEAAMDWGATSETAAARVETITREQVAASGLDLATAQRWLKAFRSRGPENPWRGRAKLMQRVVALLEGKETKGATPV